MKKIFSTVLLCMSTFLLYGQIHFHSAEEAADYALSNSLSYTYQRASTSLAVKMSKYSIESFLPTFNINWSDNKNKNYYSLDSSNKSLALSVTQGIFDGGKRKLAYDMQLSSSLYNYQTYLKSEKEFRSDIISQYCNCITSQKMLEIKKNLENVAREQLNILKTEYELGRTLENDYLEYLISFKKIQNERIQYAREYRTLLRKFKIALSLEPDAELVLDDYNFEEIYTDFVLEDYLDFLWNRFKAVSPEYQQLYINLQYAKKQYQYTKRQFLPEISVQADVNFSDIDYPLNSPSYNIKFNFAFSNFPLFPVSLSSGIGVDSKGRFSIVKNDFSVTMAAQPNYFNSLRNKKISMNQQKEERKNSENSYYDSLFDSISQYDDYTNNVLIYNETIKIQEKRLLISQEQVNSGMLSRIDYLDELIELASQKIELINSQNNLLSIEHNLEIMLDIPFGGLKNVCKANSME